VVLKVVTIFIRVKSPRRWKRHNTPKRFVTTIKTTRRHNPDDHRLLLFRLLITDNSQYSNWAMGWLPGFDPSLLRPDWFWGPPSLLLKVVSLWVKRQGSVADHLHPSNAVVKNTWGFTSTSPYICMAWCLVKQQGHLYLLSAE
jgi:hypothetical protein